MAYNKGDAIVIPAMASKSCNGVSQRELYMPLTASYGVSGRTYTITVDLSCYFGTRIQINNTFSNIYVNGVSLADATVNGWVSADEPGKNVASTSISGTFNADGTPDHQYVVINVSGRMTYYSDFACQTTKTTDFSNSVTVNIADISPNYTDPAVPTLAETTVGDDFISGNIATTSFGEGGGKYLKAQVSKNNFSSVLKESNTITELSGEYRVPNLQRNTLYYLRGYAANNGRSVTSAPVQVYTLAASEIYNVSASEANHTLYLHTEGMVYYGGGAKEPTTYIDYSTDLITWSVADTTEEKGEFESNASLNWPTHFDLYVRTRTVTDAGTYTSGYRQVTVGDRDSLYGSIDSVTPGRTSATVNMTINTPSSNTVNVVLYRRLAGIEEEWSRAWTTTTAGGSSVSLSYTMTDLNQNNFEYEISLSLSQTIDGSTVTYDTDTMTFFTIPYSLDNNTCDSLSYIVDLICQSVEAIKHGNMSLFMNSDTKTWCEEDDDDAPTVMSMMSRVVRFLHAVCCVLCTSEGFLNIQKDNDAGQVFMGKLGWTDIDDEVTSGSKNPVFSGAVYTAIDEFVHQVWHYFGTYDYYGYDLADLQAQSGTATNQTGLVGTSVYKWNGSAWANPTTVTPENFGVIHVDKGTHADKAYYWFYNSWNRLDVETEDIENRIEALEDLVTVETLDGSKYIIATADVGLTDAQLTALIPTNATKDTIILITEEVS